MQICYSVEWSKVPWCCVVQKQSSRWRKRHVSGSEMSCHLSSALGRSDLPTYSLIHSLSLSLIIALWSSAHSRVCHICRLTTAWKLYCRPSTSWTKTRLSHDATPSKCEPPPQQCIWSRYDLDLRPLTLKTFAAVATHATINCCKFYWNLCIMCRNIASRAKFSWPIIFDLWPRKPVWQWPVTWWLLVPRFIEIRARNEEKSHHVTRNRC